MTILEEGSVWNVTPETASVRARQVVEKIRASKRVQMLCWDFPAFLLQPPAVFIEVLLAQLDREGSRSPRVLKTARRFAYHWQAMLEAQGCLPCQFIVAVPEDRLRALALHQSPFDSLEQKDIDETRKELTGNWVPNGLRIAALPPAGAARTPMHFSPFEMLMTFDHWSIVARPRACSNLIYCEAKTGAAAERIGRYATALTSLIRGVPYELHETGVINAINELFADRIKPRNPESAAFTLAPHLN